MDNNESPPGAELAVSRLAKTAGRTARVLNADMEAGGLRGVAPNEDSVGDLGCATLRFRFGGRDTKGGLVGDLAIDALRAGDLGDASARRNASASS